MEKIMEIPGGMGSNAKPSGTENSVGWGVKLEKTLHGGGYGYFLEPHIDKQKLTDLITQSSKAFLFFYTKEISLLL